MQQQQFRKKSFLLSLCNPTLSAGRMAPLTAEMLYGQVFGVLTIGRTRPTQKFPRVGFDHEGIKVLKQKLKINCLETLFFRRYLACFLRQYILFFLKLMAVTSNLASNPSFDQFRASGFKLSSHQSLQVRWLIIVFPLMLDHHK